MSWLVATFAQEWSEKVKKLKKDINEQKPNEDDYIYKEVKEEIGRLLIKNEEPDEAAIKIYGLKIKKKIVHRKTEKYNGADVYLEVENEKFALVQFKLKSKTLYRFDANELKNLGTWCSFNNKYMDCPTLCPSFVWLIDNSKLGRQFDKHRILRLCKVNEILEGKMSAPIRKFEPYGITRSTFKELLAKCWAGAPYNRKPSIHSLEEYSALAHRLVIAFFIGD